MNHHLANCLSLSVLAAASAGAGFLIVGGGMVGAFALYTGVGSVSLVGLALTAPPETSARTARPDACDADRRWA